MSFVKYLFPVLILLSFQLSAQTSSEEQLFRKTLNTFKTTVTTHHMKATSELMNFPFYTTKAEDDHGKSYPSDLVNRNEFKTYSTSIFNEDVIRLLPKITENNLSEIADTDDHYYADLRKMTDKGSKLYEVYFQYQLPGRNTESYFSFIFGRLKGSYRVIAYYSKWPIR